MIYRFNVQQSMRCFADISATNRMNKARYSSIIVCITFAQYCILWNVVNLLCFCNQITSPFYGALPLSVTLCTLLLPILWCFPTKCHMMHPFTPHDSIVINRAAEGVRGSSFALGFFFFFF